MNWNNYAFPSTAVDFSLIIISRPLCSTDFTLQVLLDPLLPRICELALSSPDAQTKTSACELLHSCIVFVVGSAATTPEAAREEAGKHHFFRRVFPVVLKLCAAPENFIQSLFQSLAFPLIRWLTSGKGVG